jgi:hypothetical protein
MTQEALLADMIRFTQNGLIHWRKSHNQYIAWIGSSYLTLTPALLEIKRDYGQYLRCTGFSVGILCGAVIEYQSLLEQFQAPVVEAITRGVK